MRKRDLPIDFSHITEAGVEEVLYKALYPHFELIWRVSKVQGLPFSTSFIIDPNWHYSSLIITPRLTSLTCSGLVG